MEVVSQTEEQLVIGDRGLSTNHWGWFMLLLSGSGFTAIYLTGKLEVGLPMYMLLFFFLFGLIAALFMTKRLTHRLDKHNGEGVVEYPVNMNTKLDLVTFKLDDVVAIVPEDQPLWQKLTTRSEQSSDMNRDIDYPSAGFSYLLSNGDQVEAGIYTTAVDEIEQVVNSISTFLDVPIR